MSPRPGSPRLMWRGALEETKARRCEFWETSGLEVGACLGPVSGHPRIRGLRHPLTTSILPQKARVHPRAGIKHGQKCGGTDYARI